MKIRRKCGAVFLVFCILFQITYCCIVKSNVVYAGTPILGVIGDVLGIAMDVVGDSAVQNEIDTINNKLRNNIAVTDEEINSILRALWNLNYNGSGALMKSYVGVAGSNYSTFWGSVRLSAEASECSYFCWVGNALYCCALGERGSYTVVLEADGTSYEYPTGNSCGTSYGSLYYELVGYRPTETYGYHVSDYQNSPVGVFDSFQDVAKAICSSRRVVTNYSNIQQNYNAGYTNVKLNGAFQYNGKSLSDYDYNWKVYLAAQGVTSVTSSNDSGETVVNRNFGEHEIEETTTEESDKNADGEEATTNKSDASNDDNAEIPTEATSTDVNVDVNDFKVDLTEFFPFCIPFDLINCIKLLSATGEAPCWEFPFRVPMLGLEDTIVIDLAKWDSVAVICRWGETLIFIGFLVSKTRAFTKG